MKQILTYISIISLLFFSSCEEKEPVMGGGVSINEFMTEVERARISRSFDDNNKTEFAIGDTIYVFGLAKATTGDTGIRFMPNDNDDTGDRYIYEADVLGWHRFQAFESEIGLWRDGFYHDFTAYHHASKFEFKDQTFAMDSSGLAPNELLWGEVKNVFFSGNSVIIPKITFNHQLSRIRIKVIHNMAPGDAQNCTINKITFNLNNSSADFNAEKGQWSNYSGGSSGIKLLPGKNLDEIPRLTSEEIIECWVLPTCLIDDFYVTLDGIEDPILVSFKHNFDPNISPPITKPGYITELQMEFGDVRMIVFTVNLVPWVKVKKESVIED